MNNGNGDTLDEMMDYDDLLTVPSILQRIQTLLKEEDIVTVSLIIISIMELRIIVNII